MPDQLAKRIRGLVDAGAPPITLSEVCDVPRTTVPLVVTVPRPRSRTVVAAAAVVVVVAATIAAVRALDEDSTDVRAIAAARSQCAVTRFDSNAEIFMSAAATEPEIAGVRAAIARERRVTLVQRVTPRQAHKEFACIFRRNPDLVATITASDLPTTFRIKTAFSRARLSTVFGGLPGVDDVTKQLSSPSGCVCLEPGE